MTEDKQASNHIEELEQSYIENRSQDTEFAECFMAVSNEALNDSIRQVAYSLQRTGNPRCEAEAMELHRKADELNPTHDK